MKKTFESNIQYSSRVKKVCLIFTTNIIQNIKKNGIKLGRYVHQFANINQFFDIPGNKNNLIYHLILVNLLLY